MIVLKRVVLWIVAVPLVLIAPLLVFGFLEMFSRLMLTWIWRAYLGAWDWLVWLAGLL